MTIHQTKLQEDLEKFRIHFPHCRKCYVGQDYITYSYTNIRHAATSCCEANLKISELNLPLVAFHGTNEYSFIVQSNETPDI